MQDEDEETGEPEAAGTGTGASAGSQTEDNGLAKSIETVLNCACRENGSDTPDFLLARFLMGCLKSYEETVRARDKWHGPDGWILRVQPGEGSTPMDIPPDPSEVDV